HQNPSLYALIDALKLLRRP
ncbi:hypothetical protein D047_2840B, partial [Vibrio parahaemolyticus VPTS-2010_2]